MFFIYLHTLQFGTHGILERPKDKPTRSANHGRSEKLKMYKCQPTELKKDGIKMSQQKRISHTY